MTYLVTKNVKTQKVAVYAIDQKADLERFQTDTSIPNEISGWPVTSANDLAKTSLSNKDLLDLFNSTRGDTPLVKFQDKHSAMERTFGVFPNIAQPVSELFPAEKKGRKPADPDTKREIDAEAKSRREAPKPPKATSPKPAGDNARQKGVISLDAQNKAYPCREGTKQAALIDALAKGATMEQLIKVCSQGGKKVWSENSVKSGIYWDVNKVKGYGIRTEFDAKGVARYFLVYPKGSDAPVPHKARASA